jgi:hypothetical protein
MTPEFLAAVIDTLLPGDEALPSGTQAGLDPAVYAKSHRTLLDTIATQAGSVGRFAQADESTRATVLTAAERSLPDAFRALLVTVLSDYYEAPAVLAALGWRVDPPQPTGHAVPTLQDLAAGRLAFAQRRGKLWRG